MVWSCASPQAAGRVVDLLLDNPTMQYIYHVAVQLYQLVALDFLHRARFHRVFDILRNTRYTPFTYDNLTLL